MNTFLRKFILFIFTVFFSLYFPLSKTQAFSWKVDTSKYFKDTLLDSVYYVVKINAKGVPAPKPGDPVQWPAYLFYVNNGANFDGIQDYMPCTSKTSTCGTPNLYKDKVVRVDSLGNPKELLLNSPDFYEFIVANGLELAQRGRYFGPKLQFDFSNASAKFLPLKLSFVYFNDYWSPVKGGADLDRNSYIKNVTLFVAEKNSSNPPVPIFSVSPKKIYTYKGIKTGFALYYDMGLVNKEGIKSQSQDGLVNAFDKRELRNIDTSGYKIVSEIPKVSDSFALEKEGSFNVNVYTYPLLLSYFYDRGKIKKGDINLDNKLNMEDLLVYVQEIVNKSDLVYDLPFEIYDLNSNGNLDAFDLVNLIQQIF